MTVQTVLQCQNVEPGYLVVSQILFPHHSVLPDGSSRLFQADIWNLILSGHFWGPAIRPHYLLHVILHGKGTFLYHGKEYALSSGDAFLIEPMQTHYYQADKEDPWEYAWVGFDGNCVEKILNTTVLRSSPVFYSPSDLCCQPMP